MSTAHSNSSDCSGTRIVPRRTSRAVHQRMGPRMPIYSFGKGQEHIRLGVLRQPYMRFSERKLIAISFLPGRLVGTNGLSRWYACRYPTSKVSQNIADQELSITFVPTWF
ncbi:hypothetical protein OG21DRAFT_1516932 [Imleria badia]|nr:hypothetical protein OG21DRAFT_1516932 [Imleria badia]